MRSHVLTAAALLLTLLLSANEIVRGQTSPYEGIVVVDGISWKWEADSRTNGCSIMPLQKDSVIVSPIPAKVTIPSWVNGMDVTGILTDAFRRCETLEEVILPSKCKEIGPSAFMQCRNLKKVVFPDNVAGLTIHKEAFALCVSLKEIKLPQGVTDIGDGAFKSSGLKTITIPGTVYGSNGYGLPHEAFVDCRSLKNVTLLNGVKKIRHNVFTRGTVLESITLPSSIEQIGYKYPTGDIWDTLSVTPFDVTPQKVYFLPEADIPIVDTAFGEKGDATTTLYVRKGEKGKVEGKPWAKVFDQIVEGYLVIFKNGDKVFTEQLVNPDGSEKASRPALDPYKRNKYFKGWISNGQPYDFNQNVANDLTLEAAWGNRITFDANGGEFQGESSLVLNDNETLAEPNAPTKAGRTFLGWYKEAGATDKYDFSQPITGNLNLIAGWDKYAVTFDPNGGTLASAATADVERGKDATKPAEPTKGDRKFLGWVKAGAPNTYSFTGAPVYHDFTLVARWDKYTITFDANGGSPAPESQAVEDGKTINLPDEPKKDGGYRVKYWTTEGAEGQTAFNFMTQITQDLTLTAIWVKTFEVKFDADGGSPEPSTLIVDINTPAKTPIPPVKSGYIFTGWTLDGKNYDFTTPVTSAITLKAKWETPNAVESQLLASASVVANPVSGVLQLRRVAAAERIEVYSLLGGRMHTQALHGEDYVAIDASAWGDGVYLVRVVASDGQKVLKIVVRQ